MRAMGKLGALAGMGLGALVGFGCGHAQAPIQKIDNAALVRLNEQQMQPVDEARIEEGRARDQEARSRAAVQDARAKIEIAKAEREVAVAQQNRSKAEMDLLTQQKADMKDIDRAKTDFQTAADRVKAVDLKMDYLNRNVGVVQLEEQLSAEHVKVAEASTERAKYQALQAANSNEIRGLNPGTIDQRLAQAQVSEANLRKQAADKRVELVDAYNRWQELDAKVRTMPQPQQPAHTGMPAAPAEPTRH